MKRIITILLLAAATIGHTQTPTFGSFGTQNDTVSALYKNGAHLYVGAKTSTPNNRVRAVLNNGYTVAPIGYTQAGYEITGIGRIASDSVYVFDKNGSNSSWVRHNSVTSNWTFYGTMLNKSYPVIADYVSGGSISVEAGPVPTVQYFTIASNGVVTVTATGSCCFAASCCAPTDFTHNGLTTQYVCRPSATANQRITYPTGIPYNITIPVGWNEVHEIEWYGGYLYMVVRNTAGTADGLFRWNNTMGSVPSLINNNIGTLVYDIELHNGLLYIATDNALKLYDWTTLSTITTFSTGKITVLESFGTKLAIGGSFIDLNGNSLLDRLAYMEYVTAPTSNFTVSNNTICDGSSLTFTNASTGNVDSYFWDIQGGTPSTSNAQDPGTVVFNNPGTFVVTLTVTNAGGSTTHNESITVNSLPTIGAGSDEAVCAGTAVTLNGSGASSYSWNNGVTNGVSFNPASTNTYTVTGTDVNGCVNTDQVVVTVNPLQNVNAGSDQSVCEGTSVTLSASGASSYAWDNSISNGVAFTPSSTVTYTVTGTNANGCVNTDQVTVTVNLNPIPIITFQGGMLSTTNISSGTFQWILNGSQVMSNDLTYIPTENGTYTFYVMDNNGCDGVSDPIIIDDLGLSDAEIEQYVMIANGQMTVNIDWSIYDVTGRLVTSGNPGKVDMPVGVFVLVTEKFSKKYLNATKD